MSDDSPKGPRVIGAASATQAGRGPRAFAPQEDEARFEEEADAFAGIDAALPPPVPVQRGAGFFTLVWSAFAGLVMLLAFDAGWSWVVALSQRAPWLGQLALGLIGIVALGLVVFLLRETFAMLRLKKAAVLRTRAEALLADPDRDLARGFVEDLCAYYRKDATAAAGRAEVDRTLAEVHDGATLLAVAERAVLGPKDAAARHLIARAAERVSVVTALSPRALVDVLFVLVQSVSLIRQLSALYGGRATGLGLLRLSARVFGYLAVTGSIAMADQMASQVLGAGLAARISARLGEGVLNGVLCARVGIAAIDLVRPMPHRESGPIYISEVVKYSLTQSKVAENPAS